MYMRQRGIGDILNPTAGTELDCGLFAGGVFNKACWCLSLGPSACDSMFGAGTYAAAQGLANPSTVYAPILAPPPVPAPAGYILTVPPASGAAATAIVDQIIAQQKAAQDAQAAATLEQAGQNIDTLNQQAATGSGFPWWAWAAVAVGAAALVAGSR
jgi:hypothetical protein